MNGMMIDMKSDTENKEMRRKMKGEEEMRRIRRWREIKSRKMSKETRVAEIK